MLTKQQLQPDELKKICNTKKTQPRQLKCFKSNVITLREVYSYLYLLFSFNVFFI